MTPLPSSPSRRHRVRRQRLLTLVGRIHRWLGIGLGLWFVLVGATGTLLVWRDEIDAALNPAWFYAPRKADAAVDPPTMALERLLERARAEHGYARIERVRLPDEPGRAVRLQVRTAQSRVESGRLEAFVDPADGALLGTRSLQKLSLRRADAMRTLYDFHRNVLLGEPGSNLVGIAGFALMASAITGAVLAWPHSRERWRKLLRINWRGNPTRVAFDLHRSGGALVVALLLLSTATGATLVYLNVVRDLVGLVSRVEPIPVMPFHVFRGGEQPLTVEQLAARVQAGFPQRRITEIRFSERSLTGVLFQLRADADVHRLGDTIAWLHPLTGEVLAERSTRTRSAGEQFMHWLLPLHVGSAFQAPGRVAMAIVGAAPLLLVASGLWVWWRKRAGERVAAARARERSAARRQRR